jgi:hypothetical protein
MHFHATADIITCCYTLLVLDSCPTTHRSADVHEVNCMQTLMNRLGMPRTNMITENDIRSIRAGAIKVRLVNDSTATTHKQRSPASVISHAGFISDGSVINADTYDGDTSTEFQHQQDGNSYRCYGYTAVPATPAATASVLTIETHLYESIMRGSGTPDILLQQPIYYYGTRVHWIEAKVSYYYIMYYWHAHNLHHTIRTCEVLSNALYLFLVCAAIFLTQ